MTALLSTSGSSCFVTGSARAQAAAACNGVHGGGTFLPGETPTSLSPRAATFHMEGVSAADLRDLTGSHEATIKLRRRFFSFPALASACDQNDLFLQRLITWEKFGWRFFAGKRRIPDTQAKILPHFKSFFRCLGA